MGKRKRGGCRSGYEQAVEAGRKDAPRERSLRVERRGNEREKKGRKEKKKRLAHEEGGILIRERRSESPVCTSILAAENSGGLAQNPEHLGFAVWRGKRRGGKLHRCCYWGSATSKIVRPRRFEGCREGVEVINPVGAGARRSKVGGRDYGTLWGRMPAEAEHA